MSKFIPLKKEVWLLVLLKHSSSAWVSTHHFLITVTFYPLQYACYFFIPIFSLLIFFGRLRPLCLAVASFILIEKNVQIYFCGVTLRWWAKGSGFNPRCDEEAVLNHYFFVGSLFTRWFGLTQRKGEDHFRIWPRCQLIPLHLFLIKCCSRDMFKFLYFFFSFALLSHE